jgi:hypothetical protein
MRDHTGAYLCMAEKHVNVPKHCHGISFREVPALADTFKELSADSELESEIVL